MRKFQFLVFLLLSFEVFAQKDTVSLRFSHTITASDLSRHLHVLASDEYEGRETGEKGQKMAAKYISEHFKNSGIPALSNGTYYQEYPLLVEDPATVNISINNKEYAMGTDYIFYPASYYGGVLESQELNVNEIVFAGFGIGEQKYNDYKKADVKSKVVVALTREPMRDSISVINGKKNGSGWSHSFLKKYRLAREKGAKALLLVIPAGTTEKFMKEMAPLLDHGSSKLFNDTAKADPVMPVIYISEQMANELFKAKKKLADELRKKINASGKPITFTSKTALSISIKRNAKKINAENVLGYVEGTDLKNEIIIVTAHYDHLGIRDGKVYNGADDDGSGTVAIMEMAEAFAKAKKEGKGPRRSVVFMAISGEEKGLLGSRYYVEHPVFPLANTVADLNIDMIGRHDEKYPTDPDYIYIIGSNMLSNDLHKINEKANETYTRLKLDYTYNNLNDKNRYYYRSDHYNFAKNNIPVIFYFNGVHKDYHKETDEVDKINFQKMEKITRLIFHTAWELANRDERIRVDVKQPEEKKEEKKKDQ